MDIKICQMKKLLAIIVLGLLWSGNVYSEIPPIKVKDLQCSSPENNFRDKYKNDYWSITKNDSFAEQTFLSVDGLEVVVWKYDVKTNLDFITFTRVDSYKPEKLKIEYRLSRKDGSMILSYSGTKIDFKCKPFKNKFNTLNSLRSKADENLKKKKSDIKF